MYIPKSRNQGFLDLTAPLNEKSVYKYSSQAKAWGFDLKKMRIMILPIFNPDPPEMYSNMQVA